MVLNHGCILGHNFYLLCGYFFLMSFLFLPFVPSCSLLTMTSVWMSWVLSGLLSRDSYVGRGVLAVPQTSRKHPYLVRTRGYMWVLSGFASAAVTETRSGKSPYNVECCAHSFLKTGLCVYLFSLPACLLGVELVQGSSNHQSCALVLFLHMRRFPLRACHLFWRTVL